LAPRQTAGYGGDLEVRAKMATLAGAGEGLLRPGGHLGLSRTFARGRMS